MRNLIVCCDGTWNTPQQEQNALPSPTNVVRLHNAVAPSADGVIQETYYHTGVGTEGGFVRRMLGGMFGRGLDMNIMSAYEWLARKYEEGDQIFLFGFSRGAYTVRSLAGFIDRCGLLDLTGIAAGEGFDRVKIAYQQGYREYTKKEIKTRRSGGTHPESAVPERQRDRKSPENQANWRPNKWKLRTPVPIHFIGVWDTVGALGIPDNFRRLKLWHSAKNWQFPNTNLGKHVRYARHAVAIDECRANFTPTLWTTPDPRVKQLWFPGVHCDVGGGYYECGLSDIALRWMIDEAGNEGLKFNKGISGQPSPNPQGILHDSVTTVFKALPTRPRNMPSFQSPAFFHNAAIMRHNAPSITQAPYHPTSTLNVGQPSLPIPVYARQRWNATGLYLEKGTTYVFTAVGEWLDGMITWGPNGTGDGKLRPAKLLYHLASSWGKIINTITRTNQAGSLGTRRAVEMPWFSLVGAIANDGGPISSQPVKNGSAPEHQMFMIGTGPKTITVENPGYLYAFANDSWGSYWNNRGSVTLRVERTK